MTLDQTISIAEAALREWDCAVVGAGPAGSLAAREIARSGASVLLVERAAFPRSKVCGCCLNPRSTGILERAGLGRLLTDAGAVPLDRFRLAAGGRRAEVSLPPNGFAISRSAFDCDLVSAAIEAGAHFLPRTTARLADADSSVDHRLLHLRSAAGESTVRCRIVVEATGLGGRLNSADESAAIADGSRTGAGTIVDSSVGYRPGTIHMACGASGYVGLVRIEDGRLDVAAAFDPAAIKAAGGMGSLAVQILAVAGLPAVDGLAEAAWKGTPLLTRRAARLAEYRHFRIGDAAGYVEPFTGEGMAWGLASAVAIAPIAVASLRDWSPRREAEWINAYRYQVARRQFPCRMAAAVLRRPGLTGLAVRALSAWPVLARPVLRTMNRM